MKKRFKQILLSILFLLLVIIVVVCYADWKITSDTKNFVYDNVEQVPEGSVALVLGTSKSLKGGSSNPYFTYRIEATKELYDAGKIKSIVVSGDNRHQSYNEPRDMKNALIKLGIPDSIIHLDYAGFRTLDSVVRMNKIFGQNNFIIVSQKFHNERAVYLAHNYGINAYGYNAKDLALNRYSIKTVVREKFARVKVFLDLLFNKQPKFLGDPIDISI